MHVTWDQQPVALCTHILLLLKECPYTKSCHLFQTTKSKPTWSHSRSNLISKMSVIMRISHLYGAKNKSVHMNIYLQKKLIRQYAYKFEERDLVILDHLLSLRSAISPSQKSSRMNLFLYMAPSRWLLSFITGTKYILSILGLQSINSLSSVVTFCVSRHLVVAWAMEMSRQGIQDL